MFCGNESKEGFDFGSSSYAACDGPELHGVLSVLRDIAALMKGRAPFALDFPRSLPQFIAALTGYEFQLICSYARVEKTTHTQMSAATESCLDALTADQERVRGLLAMWRTSRGSWNMDTLQMLSNTLGEKHELLQHLGAMTRLTEDNKKTVTGAVHVLCQHLETVVTLQDEIWTTLKRFFETYCRAACSRKVQMHRCRVDHASREYRRRLQLEVKATLVDIFMPTVALPLPLRNEWVCVTRRRKGAIHRRSAS